MLHIKEHPHILKVENAIVVAVDMQEPFLQGVFERERVVQGVRTLLQGARVLSLPVLCTTQYAKRMGETVPEIKELLNPLLPAFDKMEFSCLRSAPFTSELQRSGRKQVLLCGVETHICINQTAHDLTAAGYQVHLAVDAVSSRTELNWRLGIDKMRQGGVLLSSVEIALYEMMQMAGTPEFQAMLPIVK